MCMCIDEDDDEDETIEDSEDDETDVEDTEGMLNSNVVFHLKLYVLPL